jgi:hypothetical protein
MHISLLRRSSGNYCVIGYKHTAPPALRGNREQTLLARITRRFLSMLL